jgi:transcriptional regulator with XRE-family HTH domain
MAAIARYLENLQSDGGLKFTDIANITDVSKATVSRWKSGAVRPHPRTELILSDLHYVISRLQEYYTADEIRTWLYARHPQLEGRRAIDLIHEGESIEVLKILERLDSGAYL